MGEGVRVEEGLQPIVELVGLSVSWNSYLFLGF